LLAASPAPGDLHGALATLAARTWRHPASGLDVRFETAQSLVHGVSQAFMKRGLPRPLMTDSGAAMLARRDGGRSEISVPHAAWRRWTVIGARNASRRSSASAGSPLKRSSKLTGKRAALITDGNTRAFHRVRT